MVQWQSFPRNSSDVTVRNVLIVYLAVLLAAVWYWYEPVLGILAFAWRTG
ncbi:MAG: hypothetical protein ACLUTA_17525 [Blautia wexlerae]